MYNNIDQLLVISGYVHRVTDNIYDLSPAFDILFITSISYCSLTYMTSISYCSLTYMTSISYCSLTYMTSISYCSY